MSEIRFPRRLAALSLVVVGLGATAACGFDEGVDEDVAADTSALVTTRTFNATADAYVDSSRPKTNFGGGANLLVDQYPATYRSYLRFDVPALGGVVKRATLRLWVTDPSPSGPTVAATSTSWTEAGITYANAPAPGATIARTGAVTASRWLDVDVTSRVTGAGAYGFVLVPTSPDGADFASRSAANPPRLVLEIDDGAAPPSSARIACPSTHPTEVFRDDFDGTALDTSKWQIIDQRSGGGGSFTQLTTMRRENVSVSGGNLRLASKRHCSDPYANRNAPENPSRCSGTNYYSGAWLKAVGSYAPGRGTMIFRAKMPAPVQGSFPALWARNTEGGALYTELDLIETWWDHKKGVAADPNKFKVTSHFGDGAKYHTSGGIVGPFANLVTAFHVWEVEWDAKASPPIRYYYRDAPGATRVLLQTVDHTTAGWNGKVTASQLATGLDRGFRPYVDFAVNPDDAWHVGPDAAAVYDPEDLLVDSVIVCR